MDGLNTLAVGYCLLILFSLIFIFLNNQIIFPNYDLLLITVVSLLVVFLFNHELLLIGVNNIWHALLVIITSLIGILVFTAATQKWFINKMRWYEVIVFLFISLSFLSPDFVLNKFDL